MRKILIVIVACIFVAHCFSVPLQAQDTTPAVRKNGNSYKMAAGLSYTAIQGDETALRVKYFAVRDIAVEAQAGLVKMSDYGLYQAFVAFIWQPYLPAMGLLSPYMGVGPASNLLHSYPSNPGAEGEIAYFGVIPYGLEYTFAKLPLAFSFDCKMPFVELNKSHLRQANFYTTIGFGAKLLLR